MCFSLLSLHPGAPAPLDFCQGNSPKLRALVIHTGFSAEFLETGG
jgi:hypothetical protein